MSLKLKTGLIAFALFAMLGVWLAIHTSHRARLTQREANPTQTQDATRIGLPVSPRPPTTTESHAAKEMTRRDADFWSQLAHPITLRHRTLLPARNGSQNLDVIPHVWLAQFGGPLSEQNRADLRKIFRITTLFPSADMCFYVRATAADLVSASNAATPSLLGWIRLEAADKIVSSDDTSNRLRIELFSTGERRRVAERTASLGGRVLQTGSNWLEVERNKAYDLALTLAELDDVYMIEPGRSKLVVHNAEAEANSSATPLFSAPYNLTGSGITVMVRDEGRIFAHPDFGSRLQFGPDVANLQPIQHATHVAGTIGGSGGSIPGAGARGFAPGCSIVSYDLNGDELAEPIQAFQSFGAVISNHSYGFLTGWDNASGTFTDNQSTFGLYGSFARNWDLLARNQGLIIVKSAGNARDGNGVGHPHNGTLAADGDFYNTIDQSGTSKNILVVGAASDAAIAGTSTASKQVLAFSSSGPVADGRLRPEIIANGDTLLSCDNTAVTGNTYVSLSGTSMAAAAVCGTTVLFMQDYKRIFGASSSCAPHYLRAVYAQTATDMGRPGPDFLHGFGMLDALAAITLLNTDGGTGSRIVSSTISSSNPERFFLLSSDGSSPIKGTLCWSDDAGDALAKKTLVNDLDMRLIKADDQSQTLPFILNPAAPDQPATQGVNSVDTIEQTLLAAPAAGSYIFAIRGTTLISSTPFAFASSHTLTELQPPTPVIIPSSTSGPPPLVVNFDGSSSSAAQGESIVQFQWMFGDGATAQGASATHTYSPGIYLAILKVTDNKGASASTTVKISVANMPPVAAISASPSAGSSPLSVLLSTDGSFDPDGNIANYAVDFGDGTTGNGPNPTHTYNAPGLYMPKVTVTDNGGASSSKSTIVFIGDAFVPATARFSLNFALQPRDTFSISTRALPIAPNVDPTGLEGTVTFGQASFNFILDSKGRYTSPVLKVKLNPLHAQMTITIVNANLINGLAASNATNISVKNLPISIPFAVTFANNLSFGSPGLRFNYTAKKDARGTGTLLKQ